MSQPAHRRLRHLPRLAGVAITAVVLGLLSPAAASAQTTATVGPGTYEQSDDAVVRTGSWYSLNSSASSGGSIAYATKSASASLTFEGDSITWYAWQSASAGKVDVYLDGEFVERVDNYASSTRTGHRAYTALDLGAGAHTIEIRSSGSANGKSSGKITHLDSFVVGAPTAPSTSLTPSYRHADCPNMTNWVTTSAALQSALDNAGPGTVIKLAPGTYEGGFRLRESGTAAEPIWICGSREAVLGNTGISGETALWLDNADHVRLAGFSVADALKGVIVKWGEDVSVSELSVRDIGQEGIHLYALTTDSYVTHNEVARTGLRDVEYGEGIYIGTSQRRWDAVTWGDPDRSDGIVIQGNTITDAGAEAIEAKEGTSGGAIIDNVIDGHLSGSRALGWVLVTGSDWTISGNSGIDAVTNGFSAMSWEDWGVGNVFRDNDGETDASGYGLWVQDNTSATVTVACNNWVTAEKGIANVFCSP